MKRFMIDDCGTLIDMHTRDTFDYVSDVCKLLNELHEENTMLKLQVETKLFSRRELEKENEQLKQQINELKEDVPLLLAFYRWYPFAVEKKEHQSYNRLWDFVND